MPSSNVTLALMNPKSPSNVGAVMRAAGCFGANAVFYSGDRYDRAKKYHTDTKQMAQQIPLTGVDDLLAHIPEEAAVICVDLVEGAVALPEFDHPQNAFYIFGPEDGTVSQEVVDRADAVVYIPTRGCLNLAATVNVVMYDRAAKSPDTPRGDELIRASRDLNNRVSVSVPV